MSAASLCGVPETVRSLFEAIGWSGATFLLTVLVPFISLLYWVYRKKRFACVSVTHTRIHIPLTMKEMENKFGVPPTVEAVLWNFVFSNTGGTTIRAEDWEEPLHIQFSQGCRVFMAEAIPRKHVPLRLSVQYDQSTGLVTISPGVMNARDGFGLVVLVTGESQEWSVSGRIVGVKRIDRQDKGERTFRIVAEFLKVFGRPLAAVFCWCALLVAAGPWVHLKEWLELPGWQVTFFSIIVLGGMMVLMYWMILEWWAFISFVRKLPRTEKQEKQTK